MFSTVESAIFNWPTDPTRRHCSNCRLARVRGNSETPMVSCTAGHGERMPLEDLIRRGARGFRVAENCDDFEYAESAT